MSNAMMMPIPEEYSKGVAAYNTVDEAQDLAKELADKTGFEHTVRIDNKNGCAVVECTGKEIGCFFGIELAEYSKSFPYFKELLTKERDLAKQEQEMLAGDIDTLADMHCFVCGKIINANNKETMHDFALRLNRTIKAASREAGTQLNAIVLRHSTDKHRFLIALYPAEVDVDIEGNSVSKADKLYDEDNNSYTVKAIASVPYCKFEYSHMNEGAPYFGESRETSAASFGAGALWFRSFWEDQNLNHYYSTRNMKKTLWSDADRMNAHGKNQKSDEEGSRILNEYVKEQTVFSKMVAAMSLGLVLLGLVLTFLPRLFG